MKKILVSLIVALVAITSGFAQFYNGEPVGTVYEYEMTNPLMGTIKVAYTLEYVSDNTIEYEVATSMPGAAEPTVMTNKYSLKDGKAYLDPTNIIEATKASLSSSLGNADLDIKLDGEAGFIPLVAKVGDKFPLNNYVISMSTMGMDITTNAEVTKFEVVREEEISTPAGTFKTFVVNMNVKTTTQVMGQNQVLDSQYIYWVVPNKGVVKTEQTMSGQTMTTILKSIK